MHTRRSRYLKLLIFTIGSLVVLGLTSAAAPARPLARCDPPAPVFTGSVGPHSSASGRKAARCGRAGRGPRGRRGSAGKVGAAGKTGAAGRTGAGGTGSIGPAGPAGPIGPAGSGAGVAGVTGPAGATGLIGLAGPTGLIGPAGATGLIGLAGPTGLIGLAGATGPAGSGATGMGGATGATGVDGPAGPAGATGTTGSIGPTGDGGATGSGGSTGAAGATGEAGATGPAASQGLSEYAFVYNDAAQTVAIDADVNFNKNGVLTAGITHAAGTPGAPGITLVNAGDYKVTFSVSGTEPNQFALFVDTVGPSIATLVPGTVYGAGAGTDQNTGQMIATFAAGGVLTLRNHSSAAAVGLATPIGGTQANTNASIVIEKLG